MKDHPISIHLVRSLLPGLVLAIAGCPEAYTTDSGAGLDSWVHDGAPLPRETAPDGSESDGTVSPPAVAHFVDVGQGDGSLFEARSGLRLVLDCGVSSKAKQYLVDRLGPGATIDALVISHPDADHLGGCQRIIDEFKVGWIFTNGRLEQCTTQTCKKVVASIKNHQLPGPCFADMIGGGGQCKVLRDTTIQLLKNGIQTRLDFVVSYDTDPGLQGTEYHDWDGNDRNNASLMTRIHEGGLRFFYPGDCEKPCQQEVLKTSGQASISSHVSLVPHHCRVGDMAQEFAKQAGTEIKVISTGSQFCARKACLATVKQTSKQYFLTNECEGKGKLRYSQTVRVKTADGKALQVEAKKPVDPWGD